MLIVRIWKPQKWIKKIKITHNPLPPLTFRCMCVYIDISSFLPSFLDWQLFIHHTYTRTPSYTHRNTQVSLVLSFYAIFCAVKNIKLGSALCSIFPSVGLKLYVPFLFFYWLRVFFNIVVFVTYPWIYFCNKDKSYNQSVSLSRSRQEHLLLFVLPLLSMFIWSRMLLLNCSDCPFK